MPKYIAIGYPDEENVYHQSHTSREEWHFSAPDRAAAERMAFAHFPYFHEVGVFEDKEN